MQANSATTLRTKGGRGRWSSGHVAPPSVHSLLALSPRESYASGQRSRSRVPENPRPFGGVGERAHRRLGPSRPGPHLRSRRGFRQGTHGRRGFSRFMERHRSRHPHPEASQGGIREAAVRGFQLPGWLSSTRPKTALMVVAHCIGCRPDLAREVKHRG
jgi:hypothetical protein